MYQLRLRGIQYPQFWVCENPQSLLSSVSQIFNVQANDLGILLRSKL